ncbi:hypothetical protein TCE0_024f07457 [Talaromyces pinophilus]|uniref:Cytochrome b561 domain-containing protein n=1 Tax=Talaromyces pinophilus TaxID=128442 RepID=A0A6V8H9G1_TALPI|nr:hypothetical protein TCE0_024f07457 [Talaromyces pinophilus]
MKFYQSTTFFLSAVFSLITPTVCQNDESAAVYISSLRSSSGNLTFALSVADPTVSQDVYFHISVPSSYSYIGIGTGTVMQDSLIFVMYSNATGDGITLSPRIATGNKEPVLASSLDVEILPGSNTSNGLMTVNARSYPWNYALGPNTAQYVKIKSNSLSANLEMHPEYGLFTMDMTRTTGGAGGIPTLLANSIGSNATRPHVSTPNYRTIIHAVLATLPLVFLLPTGVVFLRFFPGSVRWHWVSQTISAVMSVLGIAVGIFLSTLFNKSKSFGSGHQIIGYIICAGILTQWFLGFWHHRLYKQKQRPTPYAFVHRNLGHFIFIFAIVNGGIGLTWSQAASPVIIGYSVAAGVVAIIHFSLVAWKRWERRKIAASEPKPHETSPDVETIQ